MIKNEENKKVKTNCRRVEKTVGKKEIEMKRKTEEKVQTKIRKIVDVRNVNEIKEI